MDPYIFGCAYRDIVYSMSIQTTENVEKIYHLNGDDDNDEK